MKWLIIAVLLLIVVAVALAPLVSARRRVERDTPPVGGGSGTGEPGVSQDPRDGM